MSMPSPDVLKVPLSQAQIEAAGRLHERLDHWRLSDSTLLQLREVLPEFDDEGCLLKALAINQLYGTQVFAIIPMSRHVYRVLSNTDIHARGVDLVDEIALTKHKGRAFRRTSFAAKFCHFFIDEDRFPIFDTAAQRSLKLHLGDQYSTDGKHPYSAFCRNLQRLCATAGTVRRVRKVDRYLWIVGMWIEWKK